MPQLGWIADCEVRAFLPYTLRFTAEVTRYEPPNIIEIRSSGDLLGTGEWVLDAQDDGTVSTFYWDVGTTSRILNLVAKVPLVKAVLKKNHDNVMAEGYKVVRGQARGLTP